MPTPIVVATDYSPSAREALAHAARIAGVRGEPLHVVTVVDSDQIAALASSVPMRREDVEKQVVQRAEAMLSRELDDAGVASVEHRHVSIGRPGREIEAVCERLGAGLLVMGYHGKSESGRGPGSVATRCVRHAPCDVLLTRRGRPGPFGRVVVGVDFSEHSPALAARGAELTDPEGGELVLLHALSNPFESLAFAGFGLDQANEYEGYADTLGQNLERMAEGLRPALRATVRAETVIDANYGRAIAEWCNTSGADLAVIGTLGKPGLRYWLLGSTAESVLRHTDAAVLAVRGQA